MGSSMCVYHQTSAMSPFIHIPPTAQYKFSHFHGEDYARLCRLQRRYELPAAQSSYLMRLCSIFLFGMHSKFKAQVEQLFVDRMVYSMHWRKFMQVQEDDWRECAYLVRSLYILGCLASLTDMAHSPQVSHCP